MAVRSDGPGEGSEFTVRIPLIAEPLVLSARDNAEPAALFDEDEHGERVETLRQEPGGVEHILADHGK